MAYDKTNAINQWLTNALTVNAVDLSDYAKTITVRVGREVFDVFNSANNYEKYQGIDTVEEISVDFYETYYTSQVDATLRAAWSNKTEFTITGRPTSGAISATNPGFSCTVIFPVYEFMRWEMRSQAMKTASFEQAGAITFPTS